MSFLSSSRPDPVRVFTLFVWVAIGAVIAGLSAPWFWLGDLTTHFRVYCFLFLVPSAAVLWILKQRKTAVLTALVAAALLPCFVPYYLPPQAVPAGASVPLKVASINVLTSNSDHETVLKEIRKQDPNIIFLMEVDEVWKERLGALKDAWPYVLEWAQADNFGVMFLSKIPMDSVHVRFWGNAGVPSVEAKLSWEHQQVTVFGIHPVPPSGSIGTRLRDEQLQLVAAEVRKRKGPVIVMGDFNTTPWASSFRRFIEQSGLRDGALGFGIQCTWRNPLGYVRIPIDHVCVSPDIGVKRFTIGSDIGSDHYPVFAELVLP